MPHSMLFMFGVSTYGLEGPFYFWETFLILRLELYYVVTGLSYSVWDLKIFS